MQDCPGCLYDFSGAWQVLLFIWLDEVYMTETKIPRQHHTHQTHIVGIKSYAAKTGFCLNKISAWPSFKCWVYRVLHNNLFYGFNLSLSALSVKLQPQLFNMSTHLLYVATECRRPNHWAVSQDFSVSIMHYDHTAPYVSYSICTSGHTV